MLIASFFFFLSLFIAAGLLSLRHRQADRRDYFLAGQSVRPWLVGLSAIATNNSGYMFIGMIGYTFVAGLSSVWLALGFVLGDFLSSLIVHRRFRSAAGRTGAVSYPAVLALWSGEEYRVVRYVGAVVALAFLLAYAGAQLGASTKALSVLTDWPKSTGAWIAAALVLVYSFAGGVRASIWTDVVQAGLMVVSMGMLLAAVLFYLGGFDAAVASADRIDGFLSLAPATLEAGAAVLFAAGWVFAGVHVIGQPHVMTRIMTLDRPDNYRYVRVWYYAWYTMFYAMVIATGLMARLALPEVEGFDPESALPALAVQLLPPVAVGLFIAGVFSACLSTADSQLLACSATLADTHFKRLRRPAALRLATALCVAAALFIALNEETGIFDLVILAWSGMGCTFAPLLLVYACGARPSQPIAVAMMLTGLATAVLWRQFGLHDAVYEGVAGTLVPLLVWGASVAFARTQQKTSSYSA